MQGWVWSCRGAGLGGGAIEVQGWVGSCRGAGLGGEL